MFKMQSKFFFTGAFAFLFSGIIISQTIIPDGQFIFGNWNKSGSPYKIMGKALVPAGQTLTIDQGVTIELAGGREHRSLDRNNDVGHIEVSGTLIAKGTQTSKIIFTGNTRDLFWGTIFFGRNSKNSSLSHCVISGGFRMDDMSEHRMRAHGMISFDENATASLNDCEIDGKEIGVYCHTGSSPILNNVKITNFSRGILLLKNSKAILNGGEFMSNGEAIRVDPLANLEAVNTSFIDNKVAIILMKETNFFVDQCNFSNNGRGIISEHAVSATINNSSFLDNYYALFFIGRNSPSIQNCMFVKNKYAAKFDGNTPVIANSTFVNQERFAIISVGGAKPVVTNSVFWNNLATLETPDVDISYSYLENNLHEDVRLATRLKSEYVSRNNIFDIDPGFVDINSGDYRISGSSPLRGKGAGNQNIGASLDKPIITAPTNVAPQNTLYASTTNTVAGNILNEITNRVNEKLQEWQQKGKFEKTEDYLVRVNEKNRKKMVEQFTQEVINELASSRVSMSTVKNEYDADNEIFKVIFKDLPPIYIKVPISQAQSFDRYFTDLRYTNSVYTLTSDNSFALLHVDVLNPATGKVYSYDAYDQIAFNSTKLNINFDPISDLSVDNQVPGSRVLENNQSLTVGGSEVDVNIPHNQIVNKNAYALIIGNEDYTKYQTTLTNESNVDFARRDAEIFAQYCQKTLGIPEKNITLITDAISSQMKREIIRLTDKAKYGGQDVELVFYYSGHGFPDENQDSYIMPVDLGGTQVKEGIKLSELYEDLSAYPCKKVTVFLDACFSGGGRNQGLLAAKAVKIKPRETNPAGNLVVFSASSGSQESLFYKEKQHGMFTYFLLKKLQETKGDVTYSELAGYLKKNVPLTSSDVNYKTQVPEVNISPTVGEDWKNWKLK